MIEYVNVDILRRKYLIVVNFRPLVGLEQEKNSFLILLCQHFRELIDSTVFMLQNIVTPKCNLKIEHYSMSYDVFRF